MKFPKEVEDLIESAIADGVLSADERAALLKRCLLSGVDPKVLEPELDRRLAERKKGVPPVPPTPLTETATAKPTGKVTVHALDDLIKEYLTDGIISEKERAVLLKKAEELGIDRDEMDLYIDAQQQKTDQAVDAAANKRRGKTCPYCGGSIPALTDKCPHCGASITPEASEELQEIFDKLEDALVNFKSGEDIEKNKAEVERYVRKAKMYYGNNPKVQKLLEEVESESVAAEENAKKNARNKAIQSTIISILTYNKKLTLAVVIIILGWIGWQVYKSSKLSPEEFNKTVTEKLQAGDIAGAKAYFSKFESEGLDYSEIEASRNAINEAAKKEVYDKIEKGDFAGAQSLISDIDPSDAIEVGRDIQKAKVNKAVEEGKCQEAVLMYLEGTSLERELSDNRAEYLSFLGSCIKSLVDKGRKGDAVKFINQQCSTIENTCYHSEVNDIRKALMTYLN